MTQRGRRSDDRVPPDLWAITAFELMRHRVLRAMMIWGFPSLLVMALSSVVVLSETSIGLPLDLVVVAGRAAAVVVVAYLACLVWAVWSMDPRLFAWSAPLGALVFAGRAGGFVSLMIEERRWELVSEAMVRVLVGTGVVLWHAAMAFYAGVAKDHYKPSA